MMVKELIAKLQEVDPELVIAIHDCSMYDGTPDYYYDFDGAVDVEEIDGYMYMSDFEYSTYWRAWSSTPIRDLSECKTKYKLCVIG